MAPRKRSRGAALSSSTAPPAELHALENAGHTAQWGKLAELWREGKHCDVEIVVAGEVFKVHKAVLAASSACLEAQFDSRMRDSHGRVEMHELEPRAFRSILGYIYDGRCEFTEDTLAELMHAANRLEVMALVEAAAEFLKSRLSPDNCLATLAVAESIARPAVRGLVSACECFVAAHFEQLADSAGFPELGVERLAATLADEALVCTSERAVFETVANWVEAQSPRPAAAVVSRLLKLIRFGSIPADELVKHVEARLCVLSPEGAGLMLAAFRNHAVTQPDTALAMPRAGQLCAWDFYRYSECGDPSEYLSAQAAEISADRRTLRIISCADDYLEAASKPLRLARKITWVVQVKAAAHALGSAGDSEPYFWIQKDPLDRMCGFPADEETSRLGTGAWGDVLFDHKAKLQAQAEEVVGGDPGGDRDDTLLSRGSPVADTFRIELRASSVDEAPKIFCNNETGFINQEGVVNDEAWWAIRDNGFFSLVAVANCSCEFTLLEVLVD